MKKLTLCFTTLLALTGCGKSIFSKYSPDEFAVESRAPLTVPKNFTLRAPEEESTHDHKQAQKRALQAHGAKMIAKKTASLSAGERALLAKTGADKADPNVRYEVNKQTSEIIAKNSTAKVGQITGEKIGAADESVSSKTDSDGRIIN